MFAIVDIGCVIARSRDRTHTAGAAPTQQQIEGLEGFGIDVVHVYGLTETHGPATRAHPPFAGGWAKMGREERLRVKAEQGHG